MMLGLRKRISAVEPSAKNLSHRVISLQVKVIDKYMPDKALLYGINALDKSVPPKVISSVVDSLYDYVPNKVRSTLISAADEYVPDTVANSRKVCAIIAGVGKYVPNKVIPSESAERWDNVKLKFHIPTLVQRQQQSDTADD